MSVGSPRIRALPERVINQIAAGEVIERPASVVKELLENSLDAGATQLSVVVEGGGQQLIRVTDNGGGIAAHDLTLALTRHCTSKIRAAEDLRSISSLGFRGEALPSIAAVSRMTLNSRTRDAEQAHKLSVEGGELLGRPVPSAHPIGTSVEVCELFFNTPARRKFLRSTKTELFHIQQLGRRIAASRMDVAIELEYGKRAGLRLPAARDDATVRKRLSKLCGATFAQGALPVDAQSVDVRLHGWLGHMSTATRHADVQFLSLGGRAIRDPTVNRALRRAFEQYLDVDMQPQYLLQLEIDAAQFDVNVHPAKLEVRFREPRNVHDFVFSTVRAVLSRQAVQVSLRSDDTAILAVYPQPRDTPASAIGEPPQFAISGYQSGRSWNSADKVDDRDQVLARIGPRFVLTCNRQDVVSLIDVVALRQEILRQALTSAQRTGALEQRPLLVPESVRVDVAVSQLLENSAPVLQRCGIDISVAGEDLVVLRAVPTPIRSEVDAPAFVTGLGDALHTNADNEQALLEVIAQIGASLPDNLPQAELASLVHASQRDGLRYGIDVAPYRVVIDVDTAAMLLRTARPRARDD